MYPIYNGPYVLHKICMEHLENLSSSTYCSKKKMMMKKMGLNNM